MLSVIYAECHLCWVSFVLSVIMLSVIMLSVIMPSVIMMNVILMNVLAPQEISYD